MGVPGPPEAQSFGSACSDNAQGRVSVLSDLMQTDRTLSGENEVEMISSHNLSLGVQW
jgi:hypothetical protein